MQKNITKKSAVVLIAVFMLLTLAFTACTPAEGFEYPSHPGDGQVYGNGGLTVRYGEYIYYVNGNQSSATSTNGYTGEVKYGDIVRMKLADLVEVLALNDDETIKSSDLAKTVSKAVFEKAEVVVPMFFYTGYTANKALNGLYIFGGKLYFTSPNTQLATDGTPKTNELCVYRADLDGKNLQMTNVVLTSTSAPLMLCEVSDTVYATYVLDNTIYNVKVGATDEAAKIAKKTSSVTFDKNTNSAYYLDEDGSICSYTAGDTEGKVLLKNEDKDVTTYTIVSTNGGYVYFTQKDSTNTNFFFGLRAIKSGWTESKRIMNTVPSGTYMCYGEKVIIAGSTFNSTPTIYQLYLTSGNGDEKDYIIPQNTNDASITLDKLDGSTLYYSCNSKTYAVSLEKGSAANYDIKELYTTISAAGWAETDSIEYNDTVYYFAFTSANNITCYEYKEKDEELKLVATSIQVTKPAEEDED
ncbi:MAG: hypothetical protein NC350_02360 [Corallococcus sp.]|nr:hypothetical protein [Corallococcus sp.]